MFIRGNFNISFSTCPELLCSHTSDLQFGNKFLVRLIGYNYRFNSDKVGREMRVLR